jgi:hypothetical protein
MQTTPQHLMHMLSAVVLCQLVCASHRFRPLILEEAGTVIAAAVAETSYAKKLIKNSRSSISSGMRSLPAQLVYLEGGECRYVYVHSQYNIIHYQLG